jgi:hypothetical protein
VPEPTLETRRLRELAVGNAAEGRPGHVAAGSGLVRAGDHVYVIGDDENELAVFHLEHERPGELVPLFQGQLPVTEDQRQTVKPDLEALTTLPPFRFHPHGALLALGSGSGEGRDRGFVWLLTADGELRGFPRVIDLGPLYAHLKREVVAGLNVEGAAVSGRALVLFQRGNLDAGRDLLIHLALEEVMHSITTDFSIEPAELLDVREFDLGEADGVPLNFSDGDALDDGRLVFSAAAEGDDAIHGSVVGVIGADGSVQARAMLADRSLKVEGVDATLDGDGVELLMVCDADDLHTPSPLLAARLPLE